MFTSLGMFLFHLYFPIPIYTFLRITGNISSVTLHNPTRLDSERLQKPIVQDKLVVSAEISG
jgi:hypothetical protein